MRLDTAALRRANDDPAYMTALANRLIATGQAVPPCARHDYRLTPAQHSAALGIDGGPHADNHLTAGSWCPLRPHHPGPHHALLRYLGGDTAVWIKWLGPRRSELVTLSDCARSPTPDDACPLFTGHPGICPTPKAT
ncbi:hypothetical protein ACIQNU_05010 [Streptomyces sp. NPDC091292]|uniref:hypothetical protein n=1 Tax=Streptomyces sp. NPDC091292 TaxID=3365991 RepID=UPI003804364A